MAGERVDGRMQTWEAARAAVWLAELVAVRLGLLPTRASMRGMRLCACVPVWMSAYESMCTRVW